MNEEINKEKFSNLANIKPHRGSKTKMILFTLITFRMCPNIHLHIYALLVQTFICIYTRVLHRLHRSLHTLLVKIADPTKSNRNHSRGKDNGGKGSMEVVQVEIGGSTRPILPKPHLIIPIVRKREKIVGGIYGNTGKFS